MDKNISKLDCAKPGIHLLHKPVGPTSFSLVQQAQASAGRDGTNRLLRMCHGGTLDPFASGLLLILVEPATRLFDHLHDIPKCYDATVCWGTETDSGDLFGKTTFSGECSNLSTAVLDDSLEAFKGWRDQTPPATSNKRIGGERAYVRAHRGEAVALPPSRVYLHDALWIDHDLPVQSRLRLTVRGGYYVRALVRDLGRALGCGAHLEQLHRTAIGPWSDPGPNRALHIEAMGLLPWLNRRELSDEEVGQLRRKHSIQLGRLIPADWSPPARFPPPRGLVRGFHRNRLCFLLEPGEAGLKVVSEFRGGL